MLPFLALRDARASCGGASVVLVPGTLDVAPTNTHVWLYTPQSFIVGTCDKKKRPCSDAMRVELRTSPAGHDPGTLVPTRARRMETEGGSDPGYVIELIPSADLLPRTRYEVWAVGNQDPRSEQLFGTMRTGNGRDDESPTWSGASRVAPIVHKQSPGRATPIESGGLDVFGPRASDGGGRVLYAAWKGEADSPIDFSRPPDGYAVESSPLAGAALVVLGWPGGCAPPTFAVPQAKATRIGLRAMDLAGNVSPPSEHRVELR
jgi:hypothetical protein